MQCSALFSTFSVTTSSFTPYGPLDSGDECLDLSSSMYLDLLKSSVHVPVKGSLLLFTKLCEYATPASAIARHSTALPMIFFIRISSAECEPLARYFDADAFDSISATAMTVCCV